MVVVSPVDSQGVGAAVAAPTRKIIHIDMDAFFAQVEQRDNPELRGRPVVVGGRAEGRGVVAAASYEARAFGVRSAMPMVQALRRCPQAVVRSPDLPRYKTVSQQLNAIMLRYTALVEPLSLDEAYLDVSNNHLGEVSATRIAQAIRSTVRDELQLTCSAGVAPCKFVAKIASDLNKPNGLCVVPPARVQDVLAPLSVRAIPGIGAVTGQRLEAAGLHRIADLRRAPDELLQRLFGRRAEAVRRRAWGEDSSPVVAKRDRKSLGIEDTFAQDLVTAEQFTAELQRLSHGLERRRASAGLSGHTLTLKVRFHDFTTLTRSQARREPIDGEEAIMALAHTLLARIPHPLPPVRLLGLSLSQLRSADGPRQLSAPWA